jgi:glycine cleavage system aminomethyltransferase T
VLDGAVARAGAVIAHRHGRSVAVNYGSAAGELAACVGGVGMADRSELVKLELSGPATAELVRLVAGGELARGGVLCGREVWWCGAGGRAWLPAERVIVLCEPVAGPRLRAAVRPPTPGLVVRDRSDEWAAIAVVGGASSSVLDSLGVFGPSGDPRDVAPLCFAPLAGTQAMWLLQSDHRALALVPRSHAPAAWHAIEQAGRPHRICCVGQDAIARYSLLDRPTWAGGASARARGPAGL